MDRINCRQCGYTISRVDAGRNAQAQTQGFCCDGCQEVFEKIKEFEIKAALRSH